MSVNCVTSDNRWWSFWNQFRALANTVLRGLDNTGMARWVLVMTKPSRLTGPTGFLLGLFIDGFSPRTPSNPRRPELLCVSTFKAIHASWSLEKPEAFQQATPLMCYYNDKRTELQIDTWLQATVGNMRSESTHFRSHRFQWWMKHQHRENECNNDRERYNKEEGTQMKWR